MKRQLTEGQEEIAYQKKQSMEMQSQLNKSQQKDQN